MSSCIIGIPVYNSGKGLPYVLKNVDKIIKIFTKTLIVFSYDNSTDNTLELITKYKENNKDTLIIKNKKLSDARTINIANARNQIMDIIQLMNKSYEYFIMMDSNEYSCIGDINIDVLEQILKIDTWDAISFDREAGYYDIWALSFDPYYYSFFHFIEWRKNGIYDKILNEIKTKIKNLKTDELLEVYSAFNGFCLYKTNKFYNSRYNGIFDINLFTKDMLQKNIIACNNNLIEYDNTCDCEHRSFHVSAIKKNNARIRISPLSLFKKMNDNINRRGPA